MGNNCTLCKNSSLVSSCIASAGSKAKQAKVLQVVKIDGKVLTFTEPILVKDVLFRISGAGISYSKEGASSESLPLDYELKIGKVYYVLPSLNSSESYSSICPSGISSSMATASKDETAGGIKRIKIVITKQQLKELLTKRISMEDVLSGLEIKRTTWTTTSVDSAANWRPNLDSIPEGVE